DADFVQEVLASEPHDWRRRVIGLQNMLAPPAGSRLMAGHTILDPAGGVVGRDERDLAWPVIERRQVLRLRGERIGTFVVSRSLRYGVEESLFAAVLGAAMGMLVFASLRMLPRAARESAQKQATLDALINSIPYSIFYKSTDGTYLGCNEAFSRI